MIFANKKYDGYYEGQPNLSYMICGARRSGTTYLGKLLWETGVMGKPFEYQLPPCRIKISSRMPKNISYWDFLKQTRTTPNGVFGFKEVAPRSYMFKNLAAQKVIYMTRRDLAAQTVSLALALNTGAFFSHQSEQRKTEYNFESLMDLSIHIETISSEWEDIFEDEGIKPLRLVYEDLNQDTPKIVADFLGVDLKKRKIVAPKVEKQGDDLNINWSKRFRNELLEHGGSIA
jgi:LPS sulfotransferase NodH